MVSLAPDGYQASERQAQNNQRIQSERRNKISVCHLVQSTGCPATGAVKTRERMEWAGRQQRLRSRINQKKQEPYRAGRNRNRYCRMHCWDSIKGKPKLRRRRDLGMVIHEPILESLHGPYSRSVGGHLARISHRLSENIAKKFNPSYVYYGFHRLFP
jgi:hypothetical protein